MRWIKIAVIAVMVVIISSLDYFTGHGNMYLHSLYRMLSYLPLILGTFWFGMRGAVAISVTVSVLFLPFVALHWENFSWLDFERLLEVVLYVVVALILGFLVEKERAEHRARLENARLAAVGRAVSEIAHDMKSPLMAIGGFAKQVFSTVQADEKARKKLGLVVRETSKLESMVREMLEFGRPLQLETDLVNLSRLADECAELSGPVAEHHGVEILTELDPDLPLQPLDREKTKQVIMNLITNAVQASPSGKTVWVKTRREKDGIVLDVSDCGCGIPTGDREKIFEPFFSTKKEGTGLGLPIVKKIVEAHGGAIFLRSNPEDGVTFSVSLPRR
jgi:signal transduction histidine kinase